MNNRRPRHALRSCHSQLHRGSWLALTRVPALAKHGKVSTRLEATATPRSSTAPQRLRAGSHDNARVPASARHSETSEGMEATATPPAPIAAHGSRLPAATGSHVELARPGVSNGFARPAALFERRLQRRSGARAAAPHERRLRRSERQRVEYGCTLRNELHVENAVSNEYWQAALHGRSIRRPLYGPHCAHTARGAVRARGTDVAYRAVARTSRRMTAALLAAMCRIASTAHSS